MLNCKEVTEICSRELEQPLGLREKVALRTHLMMCSGCTNFRKQMEVLRRTMRNYADGQAVTGEPVGGQDDPVR
jgi:predicted anti-sigma-YlaC factor YlaD